MLIDFHLLEDLWLTIFQGPLCFEQPLEEIRQPFEEYVDCPEDKRALTDPEIMPCYYVPSLKAYCPENFEHTKLVVPESFEHTQAFKNISEIPTKCQTFYRASFGSKTFTKVISRRQ